MANLTIEAVNLSKVYGKFTALSNLNLKMSGAKCVGFLGPNGAGKTTTLKIFTDLIRPTSGEALINGINVHTQKKKALASCGALIETPEIYPSLTPREALSMVAKIKGIPRDEVNKNVESVIEEVKMKDWIDKKVGKFSKGMKQRVMLGAALIGNPEIIFLDEPTSGLDPRGMSEVRDIIKSLKRNDRLIFMSSHILNEVSEICDEVALIDHGELRAYGKINDVISRFSGEGNKVIEVSFSKPIADSSIERIRKLEGVISLTKLDPMNLSIKIAGKSDVQEKLLLSIANMKIGMVSFKPSSSALEEAYLSVFKETL